MISDESVYCWWQAFSPPSFFFFPFFHKEPTDGLCTLFWRELLACLPGFMPSASEQSTIFKRKKKATRVIGYHVWEPAGLTCSSWVGRIPAVGAFPRPAREGSRATWHCASLKGHLSGRAAAALDMGSHCAAATADT